MEQTIEKRGYLLEDYRVFRLADVQGMRIDYHYHEFCKLLLLRSGCGDYTVDGQRYTLEAGDVVLIPSRCVHRPEFASGVPYERTIIYISQEFLLRNSTPDCSLLQVFSGDFGHVLRPNAQNRMLVFGLADQLERELADDGYGHTIIWNTTLLRLLAQIGRSLQSSECPQLAVTEPSGGRIPEIRRSIDAHLEEDLTIDMLAERFFVSKYHMMRQFRKETGTSIHNYLCERRLFLARERIWQGMSATDSCFRSGFRSYSSFTRSYAKLFGTTPTGRGGRGTSWEESFE